MTPPSTDSEDDDEVAAVTRQRPVFVKQCIEESLAPAPMDLTPTSPMDLLNLCPKGSPKTIYFIRHGESEANAARLEGNGAAYLLEDALLTSKGERQARELMSNPAFRGAPPQLVLVSPMRRTMQTAMLGFGEVILTQDSNARPTRAAALSLVSACCSQAVALEVAQEEARPRGGGARCAFELRPDLQETGGTPAG